MSATVSRYERAQPLPSTFNDLIEQVDLNNPDSVLGRMVPPPLTTIVQGFADCREGRLRLAYLRTNDALYQHLGCTDGQIGHWEQRTLGGAVLHESFDFQCNVPLRRKEHKNKGNSDEGINEELVRQGVADLDPFLPHHNYRGAHRLMDALFAHAYSWAWSTCQISCIPKRHLAIPPPIVLAHVWERAWPHRRQRRYVLALVRVYFLSNLIGAVEESLGRRELDWTQTKVVGLALQHPTALATPRWVFFDEEEPIVTFQLAETRAIYRLWAYLDICKNMHDHLRKDGPRTLAVPSPKVADVDCMYGVAA